MKKNLFPKTLPSACLIAAITSILGFGRSSIKANPSNKIHCTTTTVDSEIPEEIAENMTYSFRTANPDETKAIIHDIEKITEFLESNLLLNLSKINPPPGYAWRLALSPMYISDNHNKNSLTIGFLPCLQSITCPQDVIEFWTSKANEDVYYLEYFKPLMDTTIKSGKMSFIFDEGQLWP